MGSLRVLSHVSVSQLPMATPWQGYLPYARRPNRAQTGPVKYHTSNSTGMYVQSINSGNGNTGWIWHECMYVHDVYSGNSPMSIISIDSCSNTPASWKHIIADRLWHIYYCHTIHYWPFIQRWDIVNNTYLYHAIKSLLWRVSEWNSQ